MFTTKNNKLFESEKKTAKGLSGKSSVFVNAAKKETSKTLSNNGALKYSTTQDVFVDEFGTLGQFKAVRPFADVERSCERLWAEDPLASVKFIHYMRTIPRKVSLMNGQVTEEPQKGAELKYEPIMRMLWLSQKAPEVFWKNIDLFISLGSWHDVFTMLQYDLIFHTWEKRILDWNKFSELIRNGLANPNTSELIKKFLPHVKAKSACTTVEAQANCIIAKWLCSEIFGNKDSKESTYKQYRKLKTSGTAHDWQKIISRKAFSKLDFAKIHGRALNKLVRSKFLFNQGLSDKYSAWIKSDKTTNVKYTGFVHELFGNLPYTLSGLDANSRDTINKQFTTLVEKARSDKKDTSCNWIVVRDTSTSMTSTAGGTTTTCFNIAKALALYFSEFLTGRFQDSYIEFNKTAKMHSWSGSNALEKWFNDRASCIGPTNFQSVFDLFVTLKQSGIDESEFPTGILCISDSEFDPAALGKTNVQVARAKLVDAGFSKDFADKFQIVLWNLQNRYGGKVGGNKFETSANENGTYYFSGFSPSVISFLNGSEILTPRQVFDAAMSQEVLSLVSL